MANIPHFPIVFGSAALIAIVRYFLLRPRRRRAVEAMAQAVEGRRQREYERVFSPARLDIACWQREIEQEIPPPYWREPQLPTFSEHVDLVAREEGVQEGQGYTNGDSNPASDSQVPRQKVLPGGSRIQYPPPSYYAY